jgi:hypothetical protein
LCLLERADAGMLNAQSYALENAAIQTMVGIRQRELDYLNTRLGAMGTQASLICGFLITTFSVNPFETIAFLRGGGLGLVAPYFAIVLMYISTAVCLVATVHCIVATTFLMIWGPGLALNGSTGAGIIRWR